MMQAQESRADMQGGLDPYLRFAGMIASSTVAMFALTYTNVFDIAHIHFSQERLYMALLMGSVMAIVMMAWMWKMHPDRQRNLAIIGGAVVIGIAAFLFSQTQALVYDNSYMRGMIPHHSIAILTSERAGIVDARVRAPKKSPLCGGSAGHQRRSRTLAERYDEYGSALSDRVSPS